MDDRSFDRLARLLGGARDRRTGLKALVGGILGAGGLAALDADADARRKQRGKDAGPDAERRRKRRKTCKPACEGGFTCVKGQCTCPSGVTCNGACCASGKACIDGACADGPGPGACIAAGEPCKNAGRPCCDGRVCSSGQGGDQDIACYAPKTGRCERTADCVSGMRCRSGRCEPPQPGDLAEPCDAAAQQLCTTPGAVCAAYTGAGSPGGTFCTLPLRKTCTGDPDCTCYKCWYTTATVSAVGRDGRASTNTKACCLPQGERCQAEQDCCLGLSCVNGFCGIGNGGGVICTPDDAEGCPGAPCCSARAICFDSVCKLAIPTGEVCEIGGLPCAEAPEATCRVGDDEDDTLRCRKDAGKACARDRDCVTDSCGTNGVCEARTTEKCETSNGGAACRETHDRCTDVGTAQAPDLECRSVSGTDCSAAGQCISVGCSGTPKVCDALTTEACGTSNRGALCRWRDTADLNDTCHDTGSGSKCLRAAGKDCTDGAQCISGECSGGVCKALTGEQCDDSNRGAVCKAATDTCRKAYGAGGSDPKLCLRNVNVACTLGTQCYSGGCANGVCKAVTEEACGGTPQVTCQVSGDVCSGTAPNQTCLRPAGIACTGNGQCVSNSCAAAVSPATGSVCAAVAGEKCEANNAGAACKSGEGTCRLAFGETGTDTRCRRDAAGACTAANQCHSNACTGSGSTTGICKSLDGETCTATADCVNGPTNATCTTYADSDPAGNRCLRANGKTCAAGPGTITADQTCVSEVCDTTCVECATGKTANCTAASGKPVCDTTAKACVGCLQNSDCAGQATNTVCKTATKTCVQCLASTDCASQATNQICNTATNACVQCTEDSHCSGQATKKTCDTTAKVCVECLQDSQCAALAEGACTSKTCNTTTKACVDGASKAKNTKCNYSGGTLNGYCSDGTGVCQEWAVCTFDRTTCGDNDVTCGNALKAYIEGTGANAAANRQVIGLPAGTYKADSAIRVVPRTGTADETTVRLVEIARCGNANPVLHGGWSGTAGDTSTGHRVLVVAQATLRLNGVNVSNGRCPDNSTVRCVGAGVYAVNEQYYYNENGTKIDVLGQPGQFEMRKATVSTCRSFGGGGIYSSMPTLLDDVSITGCTASNVGGGMYMNMIQSASTETTKISGMTLTKVTMSGNTANAIDYPNDAPFYRSGTSLFVNNQLVTCTANSGNALEGPATPPPYACWAERDSAPTLTFANCGCTTSQICTVGTGNCTSA